MPPGRALSVLLLRLPLTPGETPGRRPGGVFNPGPAGDLYANLFFAELFDRFLPAAGERETFDPPPKRYGET